MGGIGSGRQPDVYSGTVEECLQIDVNKLVAQGAVGPHRHTKGQISWESLLSNTSSIGYEAQCYGKNGHVDLLYETYSILYGKRTISYRIDLHTTKPHFGGVRWWFICPNEDCHTMVAKLYQIPDGDYFLCRTCNNLTYQSCRDSHKNDEIYRQIAVDTGMSISGVKQHLRNSALQLASIC